MPDRAQLTDLLLKQHVSARCAAQAPAFGVDEDVVELGHRPSGLPLARVPDQVHPAPH